MGERIESERLEGERSESTVGTATKSEAKSEAKANGKSEAVMDAAGRNRVAVAGKADPLPIRLLEWIDSLVYGIVGGLFCLAALLSLAYGIYAFASQIGEQATKTGGFDAHALIGNGVGAQDIISLVSDLLLTLIIMEVLGTVVHYLRERETTLKPFLFIGIISATRGILAVGARLSVSTGQPLGTDEFIRDMVELGVNAAVIIALGVTMRLIGKFLDDATNARHAEKDSEG